MNPQQTERLSELLSPAAEQARRDLSAWVCEPDTPARLAEAMRYCVLDGGKRLRPALVYLGCEAVGGARDDESCRRAAVAVELLHGYSLVHDDLPAMDDDTLRRGRPTAHVAFGEAMAVLAGDALLTRAFGVLAEGPDATLAGRLCGELAAAGGSAGMIAGQVADMDLCELPAGEAGLKYIHRNKTAMLIRGAVRMGAICGRATQARLDALGTYGLNLGLAFQLVDDILDVTGSPGELGKTPGKDAQAGKRTYVAELGLDAARSLCDAYTSRATAALEPLGTPAAALLSELAERLTDRSR